MSRSQHRRMNARRWHGSGPVCSFRPTPGTAKARRWARIDRREADRILRWAFVRARAVVQL